MKYLFLFLLLAIAQVSCSDESMPITSADDPSNLEVNVLVYENNSGIVAVSAEADNAVEYQFFMGENENQPIVQNSGDLEYSYENSGRFDITVRAYGPSGRYIAKQRRVNVISSDPVDIGQGYSTPISYPGMTLKWNDEFEGNILNDGSWSYDIGTGCPELCGWGNNELQYYREENVKVEDGNLVIEARNEIFEQSEFTSGKIVTRNKEAFQYGRIDVRAILPSGGQGMWPAFWLLGTNQPVVGWPACGEIDVMEMIGGGGRERTITGNVFWDDNGTRNQPNSYTLSEGFFFDEYHVFSIIWTEEKIDYYVDDQFYKSFDITSSAREEFKRPFYFIINLAVGGNFPGSPDDTTQLPSQLLVDYVRVFEFN